MKKTLNSYIFLLITIPFFIPFITNAVSVNEALKLIVEEAQYDHTILDSNNIKEIKDLINNHYNKRFASLERDINIIREVDSEYADFLDNKLMKLKELFKVL